MQINDDGLSVESGVGIRSRHRLDQSLRQVQFVVGPGSMGAEPLADIEPLVESALPFRLEAVRQITQSIVQNSRILVRREDRQGVESASLLQ